VHRSTSRRTEDALDWIVYLAVASTLALGWHVKDQQYVVPDRGLGYALGILGGILMLALLLYPLRKRLGMRRLGSVKGWFRAHILLGVLAPTAILFHANFGTGSLNDSFALYSMLVVAGSGFLGRHLYARIHHGLYGRRATLEELKESYQRGRQHVVSSVLQALDEKLAAAEEEVLRRPTTVVASALLPLRLALKTPWTAFVVRRFARRSIRRSAEASPLVAEHRKRLQKAANKHIAERLRAVRDVAEFRLYERLFSLWHTIHYPLFLVLIVAATLHVVAVHLY
jgi:hypothetical protein